MRRNHEDLVASPEYDPATDMYHARFDRSDCAPSVAVVLALSTVTESDPLTLEVLNDTVDPDALDRVFSPKPDGTPRADGHVTFPVSDHEVTVHGNGAIDLRLHEE